MFKKSYILNEKLFTFGPLLVIPQEDLLLNEEKQIFLSQVKDYNTKVKFTNISPFPIKLQFELEDVKEEPTEEELLELEKQQQKNKKSRKKVEEPEVPPSCFELLEVSKELQINETYELKIKARPFEQKTYLSNLICKVENNPKIQKIPIECIGLLPSIELEKEMLDFD